jgi:cytochrome c-type biogenesis protein CcmE
LTRERRQHYTVLLAGVMSARVAAFLVLGAYNDNLVFFYSPTEPKTEAASLGRQLRVTDGNNPVVVAHAGGLPDLLGEDRSVVADALKKSVRWRETRERKVME